MPVQKVDSTFAMFEHRNLFKKQQKSIFLDNMIKYTWFTLVILLFKDLKRPTL